MQFTFNILWVTLTQKIITHRVLKISQMDMRGFVWVGESFLNLDKQWLKIIEWIFMQFTFNILRVTLTQKIITHRVLKIHKWIWGDLYEWGKVFLNHDNWHKIIEWFFMQFTFNILQVTLTQKIITCRVSKIHKWIWGDLYEWEKVS